MRKLETELNDRTLRFDGVSILNPEQVVNALARGISVSQMRVRGTSEEVEQFNSQVAEQDRLRLEAPEPIPIQMDWQLPDQYKNMNLRETIVARAVDRLIAIDYDEVTQERAALRIQTELDEIEARGMVEFMKTIIYVLDTFREKDIFWGVGRGSSCACYILFILGLHCVDCVKFDVPMSEFFHD